jgi:hypothetical protein
MMITTTTLNQLIDEANDRITQVKEENCRLREALEYYADMKAMCSHDDSSWCDHCPDGGRIARKALEGEG